MPWARAVAFNSARIVFGMRIEMGRDLEQVLAVHGGAVVAAVTGFTAVGAGDFNSQ